MFFFLQIVRVQSLLPPSPRPHQNVSTSIVLVVYASMSAKKRLTDTDFKAAAARFGFAYVADAILSKRLAYKDEENGDDPFVGSTQPLLDIVYIYNFYRTVKAGRTTEEYQTDHFLWKYATDTVMDFAFNARSFEEMGSPSARQLNRALVMPSSVVTVLDLLMNKVARRNNLAILPSQLPRHYASVFRTPQQDVPLPGIDVRTETSDAELKRDYKMTRIALLQILRRGVLWPESAVQLETRTLAFFGADYDLQCRLLVVPFNQTEVHYWSAIYLYDEVQRYVAVLYFDTLTGIVRDSERLEKINKLTAAFRYAGWISSDTPVIVHGALPVGMQADGRTCGIQHVFRAHALVRDFADHGDREEMRQPVTVQRLLQHRLFTPAIPDDMRVVFSPDVCRDELYRLWRLAELVVRLFPQLKAFPLIIDDPDLMYREGLYSENDDDY
jgi:hypothetical protein